MKIDAGWTVGVEQATTRWTLRKGTVTGPDGLTADADGHFASAHTVLTRPIDLPPMLSRVECAGRLTSELYNSNSRLGGERLGDDRGRFDKTCW